MTCEHFQAIGLAIGIGLTHAIVFYLGHRHGQKSSNPSRLSRRKK